MSTQPRGPWTPIASFPLLRNRTISPDPSHNPACHEGDPDFLYGCPRFHIQRRWSVLQDPGPWYVDRQADPPRSNPLVPPGGVRWTLQILIGKGRVGQHWPHPRLARSRRKPHIQQSRIRESSTVDLNHSPSHDGSIRNRHQEMVSHRHRMLGSTSPGLVAIARVNGAEEGLPANVDNIVRQPIGPSEGGERIGFQLRQRILARGQRNADENGDLCRMLLDGTGEGSQN